MTAGHRHQAKIAVEQSIMTSIVTSADIRIMNRRGRIALYLLVVFAWQVVGWLVYRYLPDTKQSVMDLSVWAISFIMVWFILCYQSLSESMWVSGLIAVYAMTLTIMCCGASGIILEKLHPTFLILRNPTAMDTVYRYINQISFVILFTLLPIVYSYMVAYLMTGFKKKTKVE